MTTSLLTPNRLLETRRYILSTLPVLYISMLRDSGGANQFLSDDGAGRVCSVTGTTKGLQGRILDGDDRITLPNDSYLNPADLTVCVWAKSDSQGAGAIVEKWAAVDPTYPYTIKKTGAGGVLFTCYDGTNEPLAQYTGNFSNDAWHFMVGQRDTAKDVIRLIYDGTDMTGDVTDTTVGAIANTDVLSIGARGNGGIAFSGSIGEVILYNKVFSLTLIKRLFEKTAWRYR